jgi:hypothetical protein
MLTTQAPQFVLPIAIAVMLGLAMSRAAFASGVQTKNASDHMKTPSGAFQLWEIRNRKS